VVGSEAVEPVWCCLEFPLYRWPDSTVFGDSEDARSCGKQATMNGMSAK